MQLDLNYNLKVALKELKLYKWGEVIFSPINLEVKMSIEAKQVMLKNLEKELGHTLTVDNMNEVLKIIADELDSYSLEHTEEYEFDLSSTDMLEAFLSAKELEGRSPKTIERYKYIITRLLVFTKCPIKSLTVYHLRKYLMELK